MDTWRKRHPQRAASSEIPRVLVVEDDEEINDLLVWYLVDGGCEVATADNGTEALACLSRASFDVIVTDLVMPGMGGMQLLREIREGGASLPVLVVSGRMDTPVGEELLELGVARCFEKPFNLREVLLAVREAAGLPYATC
jgi:two-component system, OmpR family, KDP operon response regulator KdpE